MVKNFAKHVYEGNRTLVDGKIASSCILFSKGDSPKQIRRMLKIKWYPRRIVTMRALHLQNKGK